MKILRVVPDLYPSVVGGLGIHAHEMSKEQAKLGHEVTVYTCREGSSPEYELISGYNIHRFKPVVKILGNSIIPNMFFSLLKDESNYDVIHAHSHLYFSTNLCAVLRNISSAPLIITNHGLNSQTAPNWLQNLYTRTGAKLTFAAADKIICYTETEKREVNNLGIRSQKISVIHNGIDTNLFVPAKKYSDKKNLLWIGRYVEGKGIDYLIDAFKILTARFHGLSLTMVGKGPEKDQIIQKITDLKLEKSITIKDFVPNSKIVDLYQSSNVFVLPSLEEGVPRTILEAMSCGIPVVCSKLPQLVDIVEGSGFLVPVKDPQALADGISEILSNATLAKRFGENGRERVIKNYSWKDTVQETIQLYEELV